MADDTTQDQTQSNSSQASAFGEKLDDFRDALERLYIIKNHSGRIKYREKWAGPALYLFGEDLIRFDNDGIDDPSDLDLRKKLEDEADLRRIHLLTILGEFEELSVESSVLKQEYIGSILDKVGPHVAPYLYAPQVIRRVRPEMAALIMPPQATQPVPPSAMVAAAPEPLSPPVVSQPVQQPIQEVPPAPVMPPPAPRVVGTEEARLSVAEFEILRNAPDKVAMQSTSFDPQNTDYIISRYKANLPPKGTFKQLFNLHSSQRS